MTEPDVFVILKDGDSHGTRDGTPLCVDLDERAARMTKVGRCVRYVSAEKLEAEQERLLGLYHDESITLRRAGAQLHDALEAVEHEVRWTPGQIRAIRKALETWEAMVPQPQRPLPKETP